MRINNKGFIATSVLYGIAALFIVIIGLVLSGYATQRKNTNNLAIATKDDLNTARYQVSFNSNTGTQVDAIYKLAIGEEYGTLPVTTKEDFAFVGWFTDITAGEKIEETTKYSNYGAQTLYAHWNQVTFVVTFDGNGGTTSTTNKKVTTGSSYGDLPTPTRENYNFLGWYTDPTDGTLVTSTTVSYLTSDQILYAHWASICPYTEGQVVKTLSYNGGVQSFAAPCNGVYKIEAYGARGDRSSKGGGGGNGGYAYGHLNMTLGRTIYIAAGGAASNTTAGWNGGGSGNNFGWGGGWYRCGGGGGGATSVTTTNRGVLSNFNSYRGEVLLVAGGGGGATGEEGSKYNDYEKTNVGGGPGGGTTTSGLQVSYAYDKNNKNNWSYKSYPVPDWAASTQTSGYAFGYGQSNGARGAGGGGGWYGGKSTDIASYVPSGLGGSSYIAGLPAFTFSGASYGNGTTGNVNGGNGYVRITFMKLAS